MIRGLAILLLLGNGGCMWSIKKIPARANFHEYAIDTTVDSESAKYYLENYLSGKAEDSVLQQKIEALEKHSISALPTRDDLKQISEEFSVDFAALFFANRLLLQSGNPELQKQYLQNLSKVRSGNHQFPRKDVLIMLVPGYDYVANGHVTGADFAKPRALLKQAGYEVDFVDIDPIGSVEENALYLRDRIRAHKNRKIAVAGASSAGPAIHLALGRLLGPGELKNVKAWLNLGGILQGSPLLDKFSTGPKGWLFSTIIWFKGWRKYSFQSMYAEVSRQRYDTLSVPKHVVIYNYFGLSLSGDISKFGSDKYSMMRSDGPNDGLTLLPDIIAPNSLSILSPKTDHFFAEDPEIDKKTLALLVTILERVR
jgi:hypothetical protein